MENPMKMKHNHELATRSTQLLVAGALLLAACPKQPSSEAAGFEVWLVDQSNTAPVGDPTHGGVLYVYEGSDLMGAAAASAKPIARIDLATLSGPGGACAGTGADASRPHMILFNHAQTHAIVSFVVSGHVAIFDAETREPVYCARMSPGFEGNIQAHAAFATADDQYIVVANQNGKLLERIRTDYAAKTFVHEKDATLNLYEGLTPSGALREAPDLRPNNAPICPVPGSDSQLVWVTLAGGGLFVVDLSADPMAIVGEYDISSVRGNGCGGEEAHGFMWAISGAGSEEGNPSRFEVYRFPLAGYSPANPPNRPSLELLFADNDPVAHSDAHGMVLTRHDRYMWVFDRVRDVGEVFDAHSGVRVNTVDLVSGASDKPTPDLGDIAPGGQRMFVSLRGPNPLSGSPHVATGSTPGLGVIKLTQGGRAGAMHSVVPISNIVDGVERADAHGVRVRVRP